MLEMDGIYYKHYEFMTSFKFGIWFLDDCRINLKSIVISFTYKYLGYFLKLAMNQINELVNWKASKFRQSKEAQIEKGTEEPVHAFWQVLRWWPFSPWAYWSISPWRFLPWNGEQQGRSSPFCKSSWGYRSGTLWYPPSIWRLVCCHRSPDGLKHCQQWKHYLHCQEP